MASKKGLTLDDRLAEAEAAHRRQIEEKFFAINEKCRELEELIVQKRNHIEKLEEDAFTETNSFSSQLEEERKARNGTDTLKSSRGKAIGIQFCESLKASEAITQTKMHQRQVEINDENEKLTQLYQGFKTKYEELTRNTPDEYLKGAMESKHYFDAKKLWLENSLQAAETVIQQEYRAATEYRVSTATSLDGHLQERRIQIESYRRNVKQNLELTKANLHQRLHAVAQNLGIGDSS